MFAHYFDTLSHFLHRRFILLLVASYVLAGFLPGPGLWIRSTAWGGISLPMVMLGLLLFNAGLGVELAELKEIRRRPRRLACGLLANLLIPIGFIALVMQSLASGTIPTRCRTCLSGWRPWPRCRSPDRRRPGRKMPTATWRQPGAGAWFDVSQSAHHARWRTAVGLMTTGDYSEDLHELATTGTDWFLAVAVIIPSALGLVGHAAAGACVWPA